MFPMAKRSSFEEREEAAKEGEEREELSEIDNENDDEGVMEQTVNEERKKKIIIRVVYGKGLRAQSASSSSLTLCCQADECGVDLRMAKKYHQRHKVCERHSKAAVVLVSGIRQRFCQQCSKFHVIAEFDDTKRSCRERLAGHNERRRKTCANLDSGTQQNRGHTYSE